MKRFRRTTALITALILLCSSFAFAGAAAIVSPTANTIIYSDNLLVSVKVTEPKTVRVSIYEEKDYINEQFVSVNVTDINDADLVLIANGPAPQITTEAAMNLPSAPAVINLSNGTAVKTYTGVMLGQAADYTCTSQLGFYTKQISDVSPGLYRVQVDTIDALGAVTETINSLVAVKAKPIMEKSNIFETPQTGALQFLQNLLKSIFR